MENLDLSIIIVSYNTKDLTVDCIRSIIKTARKISFEIIVVDNASIDETVESIKKQVLSIKNIKIIENKKNLGFSKANNQGVEQSRGRHVLFLNPDTVVYKNTLDGMVEFMDKTPRAGAATCFIELPSGELDDAAHRGFPTPFRALLHFGGVSKFFPHSRILDGYHLGYQNLDKVHEIEACTGAFMIVRRAAGEEVGWWDEDYFWYGEDLDFCYRLAARSWKVYFVPKYRILHYKGASSGIKETSKTVTQASYETKIRATDARFQAMRIFYKKHYTNKYPKLITGFVMAGINIKHWLTLQRI